MTFIPSGVGVTGRGHVICRDEAPEQTVHNCSLTTDVAAGWVPLLSDLLPAEACRHSSLLPPPPQPTSCSAHTTAQACSRAQKPTAHGCCSRTCSVVQSPVSAALLVTQCLHPYHGLCLCCCLEPSASSTGGPGHPQHQPSPVPVAVPLCLWQPRWWSRPSAHVPSVLLRGTDSCACRITQIPMPTALVPATHLLQRGLRPNIRGIDTYFSHLQHYLGTFVIKCCSITKAKGLSPAPEAFLWFSCHCQAHLTVPRPTACSSIT